MAGLGYTSFFGFVPENVWGTKVSPTTLFVELNRGGDRFQSRENLIIKPSITDASIRLQTRVRRGLIECGGEQETFMLYEGFESLLRSVLGGVPTTSGAGIPYEHTFPLSPSGFASSAGLTTEVRRDYDSPNSFFYEGSIIDFAEFSLSQGDPLMKILFGMVARDVSVGSPSTATFPTAPPISYYDDGSGSGLEYNNDGYCITAFRTRLQWNVKKDRTCLGSRRIRRPVFDDSLQVTGEMTAEFENLNAFNDFRNAQARPIQLRTVGDAIGSGNYEMQINVPNAIITPTAEPQIPGEGVIYATYPFQGFWDGVDREINIVLKNRLTAEFVQNYGSSTTA